MLKIVETTAVSAALVFALCLLVLIFLYGSPPSTSEPPQQQHSEKDKAKKDTGEADKSLWQKAQNDPVAFFTLWLVIFTAVLSGVGVLQLKLLGRAETVAEKSASAAKDAAEAAKQSADATLDIERPFIFIQAVPGTLVIKNDTDTPASFRINLSYTNLGRVPAIIRLVYAQCFVADQLNPAPAYSMKKFRNALSAISAGNTLRNEVTCDVDPPLTPQDWADMRADKKGIVLTAVALYEGALDFSYAVAVAYKVDPFTGHAYVIGGPAYNYDQKERGRSSAGQPIQLPNIVP